MAASMIPIVLAICTVLLGLIAGWSPFGVFSGLVVLGLFVFVIGGLVKLLTEIEVDDGRLHRQ